MEVRGRRIDTKVQLWCDAVVPVCQDQDLVALFYAQIKAKSAKDKEEDGSGALVAWCYSDRGWGDVLL